MSRCRASPQAKAWPLISQMSFAIEVAGAVPVHRWKYVGFVRRLDVRFRVQEHIDLDCRDRRVDQEVDVDLGDVGDFVLEICRMPARHLLYLVETDPQRGDLDRVEVVYDSHGDLFDPERLERSIDQIPVDYGPIGLDQDRGSRALEGENVSLELLLLHLRVDAQLALVRPEFDRSASTAFEVS